MNPLSAYPALNKAFNRATLEFVVPLIVVCICSPLIPRILSDLDNIDKGGIAILLIFGFNVIALISALIKRLNREKLARELCEYAGTWGDQHKVLLRIDKILTIHNYGNCIISDGWLVVAPDLEERGFFPISEITELYIRTTRHSYQLWAVLIDTREFKLGKNRRQAAIAYRAILKYDPQVPVRSGDESAFERLLGMWSTWHGLHDEDPEELTLKARSSAWKKKTRFDQKTTV